MVRTIVIRVDARAAASQQRRQMPVHLVDDRFGEEPARDAGLVRHHDDGKAGAIEQRGPHRSTRDRTRRVDAIEVADFLDEGAVAIEEHRPACQSGSSLPRPSQHPRRVAPATASTRDAAHALMIERALAQHARPAPDRVRQDARAAATAAGAVSALVGRTEYGGDRHADRRGQMHGAGVVRHERAHDVSARRRAPADRSGRSD